MQHNFRKKGDDDEKKWNDGGKKFPNMYVSNDILFFNCLYHPVYLNGTTEKELEFAFAG